MGIANVSLVLRRATPMRGRQYHGHTRLSTVIQAWLRRKTAFIPASGLVTDVYHLACRVKWQWYVMDTTRQPLSLLLTETVADIGVVNLAGLDRGK